ncbi:MAG: TldD/PmbA family protein [Terriglobia bacterium]
MILSRQFTDELSSRVLKYSRADETEVSVAGTFYSLTRFANNAIHQNVAEEDINVSVRAVTGGRMARASTNKLDDDSLRNTCESALALAKLQPPHPDLLPMPSPGTYQAVDRMDHETAGLSPKARAETVREIIHRAEQDGLTAAGVFSSGSSALALSNSGGLAAFHEESISEFSVTMLGESSSGWAKRTGPRWQVLAADELADRAARKALRSREPEEAQPGKYTVILEPSAVMDLLGFLLLDFGGLSVFEKRSCFTDRVGQKVFGQNIRIHDDVYHPLSSGAPFDGEGVPRQRVALVENGTLSNLVYCRQTAHNLGAKPTGHGFPLPNEYGEAPLNLVLEGGTHTPEEMIRSTDRGLLVTRFWYIREVDPYSKILTGMTRDGTFLIEKGEVKHGVKNLRFNQSIIEMLNQVEMMSPSQRAAGEESIEMVVPAMKIRDFSFSSLTKF